MFWIDFEIPLSDQFEIEKGCRHIIDTDNIEELKTLACSLLRFAMQSANISNQLVNQMAEVESDLLSLGHVQAPTAEHHRIAAELLADQRASS